MGYNYCVLILFAKLLLVKEKVNFVSLVYGLAATEGLFTHRYIHQNAALSCRFWIVVNYSGFNSCYKVKKLYFLPRTHYWDLYMIPLISNQSYFSKIYGKTKYCYFPYILFITNSGINSQLFFLC